MSPEGIVLAVKTILVVEAILFTALFRTMVGPGRRRGQWMLAGTLLGLTLGVIAAYPISGWLGTDVSAVGAFAGIQLGWIAAWPFARRIPRETS